MHGSFHYWLLAVTVFDSISLVIDVVDIARYWMGERQPILKADNNAF